MMKYRAEVAAINENVWSCNAMEYDTREEVIHWLKGLAGRWFGYDLSRIVPIDTLLNQPVNIEQDDIFQNFRN